MGHNLLWSAKQESKLNSEARNRPREAIRKAQDVVVLPECEEKAVNGN